MNQRELIQKIHKYFTNKPSIVAVYLYGSYAKKEEKQDSDVDLAVLFDGQIDDRLSLRLQYEDELGNILGKKVEIQELNICRVDFSYRVLQEGISVYSGNECKRVNFEIKIMQNFFDLQPFFTEYYQVLRKQSLKGNFHD